MINVDGLDLAEVLAALYNASRPLGMGFMVATQEPMTTKEARGILAKHPKGARFDYLKGRVMKIKIERPCVDPCLYDRDNGIGAAERAIARIRKGKV